MVRSPFAHATITNIDTEAAKASPNVVTVITGRDVADEQGGLPNAWPITPDQVTPNHPPIAVDRATFAGEIVAVVVARSAAAARDAAELVDVDYDELPAALDLKEAAAADAENGGRWRTPTSAPTSRRSGSSTRPRPAPAATSTRRSRRPAATAS